jgi:ribosomal protein L7Ae-like RNA K-turn-binding protein
LGDLGVDGIIISNSISKNRAYTIVLASSVSDSESVTDIFDDCNGISVSVERREI